MGKLVMGKQLKIALFSDAYEPQVNGVVTSVRLLKEELESRGHKVVLFAPEAKMKHKKGVYPVPSMPLPLYWSWRIGVPFGFFLRYSMRKIKGLNLSDFDIVHVHTPAGVGIDGIILAKLLNLPSVMTYHTFFPKYVGLYFPWMGKRLAAAASKGADAVLNWLYSQADATIVPSEDVMKYLKSRGFKKPMFVVPTGVKMKRKHNRERVRKKFGWTGKKILLHVARLSPEKNIDFLLRTMKLIEKERDDVYFYITSTGPSEKHLKSLAKRLGLKNVFFTGFVSDRQLEEMYSGADAFVFASETDTQAIVLMEAAFQGLPIIVRNAPVTGSFVKRYGGLVARREPADMKEKIYAIIDNPGLRDKISSGYKRVVDDFNVRRCIDDMIKVYNIVIEIKKREVAGRRRV